MERIERAGAVEDEAPSCPACSSRSWVASRPRRGGPGRHPQDAKGWFDRAFGAFMIGMLCAAALGAISIFAAPLLPEWAAWALRAAAFASTLAAVVVADGLAVESKSCQVVCAGCGGGFIAPWRPGR